MAGGFIDTSSLVFTYIGAAIILYGGAITVIKTLSLEIRIAMTSIIMTYAVILQIK